MSFNTDKQTMDELGLLGKYRHGSVYQLFNVVKTRGGEQLLDSMFRNPLETHEAINARSAIFQHFQTENFVFPIDVSQLNTMREYLDEGTPYSLLQAFVDTFIKKCLARLTKDNRYREKVQGLQATIVILKTCYTFLEEATSQGPYSARLKVIKAVIDDNFLSGLRKIDIYKALSVRSLARYDHALKSKYSVKMEDILAFIYELDVNIAISDVGRSRDFAYAIALPKKQNVLSMKGLCHPCIEGAVGNDLSMDEKSNLLFLTGANMAGKSTLMKSVGIAVYMAHMGFPLALSGMSFSVRDGIYSSINVSDNIGLGYSHFYAEVLRVKQAAEETAKGKALLVMFDELFKGTNVKDAYDGTLAVTEAFSDYTNSLFIVSTHIIEVAEALKHQKNIQFSFLPTVMEGSRPRYTFRLKEGITEDRQGMIIIKNEGILELLNNI
jgi:DNA mismatch repair ATPase MutS